MSRLPFDSRDNNNLRPYDKQRWIQAHDCVRQDAFKSLDDLKSKFPEIKDAKELWTEHGQANGTGFRVYGEDSMYVAYGCNNCQNLILGEPRENPTDNSIDLYCHNCNNLLAQYLK